MQKNRLNKAELEINKFRETRKKDQEKQKRILKEIKSGERGSDI